MLDIYRYYWIINQITHLKHIKISDNNGRCYFFPDVNESGTIDIKDFDLAVQVSM